MADFRKYFKWLLCAFLMSLAISASVQAEDKPVISTATLSAQTTAPAEVAVSTAAPSEQTVKRIVTIRIEGNRSLNAKYLLTKIKTRKKDSYDPDQLRKDIQALYAMGNFDDVALDVSDVPGGVVVTFKVVEKPVIKMIKFRGNKNRTAGDIKADLTLKEDYPLDKMKLNTDLEKIVSGYKDEGYAAAQVEPVIETDAANRATLTFVIAEGLQVHVDRITFQGITAFPVKRIAKLMKTRRKKPFKPGLLTKDMAAITRFYQNRGYPNMKVVDLKPEINSEKLRVSLSITIDEGPLMHFGTTTFTGDAIFAPAKLMPAIQYKAGDLYNQEKVDATVKILNDSYGAQGYIQVKINPTLKPEAAKGVMDIEFQITEGDVIYIDHIGVEGLKRTHENVVRREIQIKEGQPFSSILARQTIERLNNLGFLDNVTMDVVPSTAPDKANVIYNVVDGKPSRIILGGGYDTSDGLYANVGYQNLNFLGRGDNLGVNWTIGTRTNSYSVSFTEPYLFGKPLALQTTLFDSYHEQPLGTNTQAYWTQDQGFSLSLSPRFSYHYILSVGYSYVDQLRYDVYPDAPTRSAVLSPQCATDPNCNNFRAIYSVFTQTIVRDTRDYYLDPSHGTRSSLAVNEGVPYPTYGVQFVKPVWDESGYIPLFGQTVLALHGQWAYVEPYAGASITDIQGQLFHVGGVDSVRGYALGAVGVSGQPGNPGGEVSNYYNAEFKFPLIPDAYGHSFLQGLMFYDIGGDWDNVHEMSYRPGDGPFGLKSGAGFGVRVKIQNFPIRLELGFPLNPAPGDAPSQFYFSIGSLF